MPKVLRVILMLISSQADLAAKNIIKLVQGGDRTLDEYKPGPPAIKVSLGLVSGSLVDCLTPTLTMVLKTKSVYQVGPNIGVKTDGVDDLHASSIWPLFGIKVEKDEDMIP